MLSVATGRDQLTKITAITIVIIFIVASLIAALVLEAFFPMVEHSSFVVGGMAFVWFILALLVSGAFLFLELSMAKQRQRNNETILLSCVALVAALIMLCGLFFYVELWEISAMFGVIFILVIWSFVSFLRTKQALNLPGPYWYCGLGHQAPTTFRFCPYCGEPA